MIRFNWLRVGLVALAVLPTGHTAPAQSPPRKPGSPYLSLTGDPLNAAGNYYGIVRPQLELRTGLQRLQGQVSRVEAGGLATQPGAQELPPTGLPAGFLNHGRYFMNSGVSGGTTSAAKPGGTPALMNRR